ncbi:MAG: DUF1003 domain-containing protein [Candidatus Gracilibacteria bacterium]|jgi:uncharacterized membrane protein
MPKKFFNEELHRKLLLEERQRHMSLKAQMDGKRSISEKIADKINHFAGSMAFFTLNAAVFAIWILLNAGVFKSLPTFDPFPFNLLTMTVSLEAIFLSVFVLISQNRAAKTDDLREEIDLHVNVRAEQEITRILQMLDEVHDKLGLAPNDDSELRSMKKRTNIAAIEKKILKEMEDD